MTYTVQSAIKPSGLNGITDDQINDHWKLYEAYVAQSNTLKAELQQMRQNGQGNTAAYADRRRRFGFEFNGMTLHEYYFGNLKANVERQTDGGFEKAAAEAYGSFDAWSEDFALTGKTRGIGWAICYIDPETGDLNNHFVQLHEEGNIAGYQPLVVMDVWEHAYMVDHQAGGRAAYIDAFLSNVNWDVVEKRWNKATTECCSRSECCAA